MAAPERPAPLAGELVLITRPVGRADELQAALEAEGARVIHIPLLSIEPLAPDEPASAVLRRQLLELDRYDRVIAVSVNAVEQGMEAITGLWPQLPVGIRWYGIGAATAAAFARWDVAATSPGGAMTTEELLALPDFADLNGERVLILRADGGREAMATAMRERGATVDYAVCYRRCRLRPEAELAAALAQQPTAVCLNSGDTLAAFVAALPAPSAQWHDLRLVLPSERVAELARAQGFRRATAAVNAGTAATLAALRS
ncbi:MAG: uroporphyrinogen-III synthase [Spongiibacteraceae bacterium]|jgi:uroporphyrinogen-III synthase|nr:uroporphyrinogen-III synthase [Spongiibacteraceae bacterium]